MHQITKLIGQLSRVLLIAFLAIGLCSNLPVNAEAYTIKMGSDNGMLAFEPKNIIVKAGDTVTWVNNKVYPHNFVFDPSKTAPEIIKLSYNNLMLKPGQEQSITIPADLPVGSYDYYCAPHRGAGMVGKLTVMS